MKKFLYLFIILAGANCVQACKGKTGAVNGKADTTKYVGKAGQNNMAATYIPAFTLATLKNTKFTQADIKKGVPLMLIYFSPDCEHCIKFMTKLQPHLKELSKIQIVLATWVNPREVYRFDQEFKLSQYPNIIVGIESRDNLMIQTYFQVKETPYTALYNKNGMLSWYYEKSPNVDHVLEQIGKLK